VEQLSVLLTQKLETLVEAADRDQIRSKCKAISAVFPYAVILGRSGAQEMLDVFSRFVRITDWRFVWHRLRPYATALFDEPSPPSLNLAIVLLSSCEPWDGLMDDGKVVTRWAAAASALPPTEEVCQSVAKTFSRIVPNPSQLLHIPIESWVFLKEVSTPPRLGWKYHYTSSQDTVRHFRGLGDVDILKSYFLFIWSEWAWLHGVDEMLVSIREDLWGIGMGPHRDDLIQRLDYVLGRLDQGLWDFHTRQEWGINWDDVQLRKRDFESLKAALLEVDREAMDILARAYLKSIFFDEYTHSHGRVQDLTRPSLVLYLSLVRDPGAVCIILSGPYASFPLAALALTLPHHFNSRVLSESALFLVL
jgi:hypothetical protein